MFVAAAKMRERSGLRYELARTLLAAGSAARRAGRRAEGWEFLDEAAVLFGDMGPGRGSRAVPTRWPESDAARRRAARRRGS